VAGVQDVIKRRSSCTRPKQHIADTTVSYQSSRKINCAFAGRNRGTSAAGAKLVAQTMRAEVPPGLPSSLLERRPDLRAAEEQLIARECHIGQAKPSTDAWLYGVYGQINSVWMFTGANRAWQFGRCHHSAIHRRRFNEI